MLANRKEKLSEMKKDRVPLSSVADIHVGLTTLADNCYIFQNAVQDNGVTKIHHPITKKFVSIESDLLKPMVKASILKNNREKQKRLILFPYRKNKRGKHTIIEETELADKHPKTYEYLLSIKALLDRRDKGKKNPVGWYAFGRQQGLDLSFGEKILTSPINLHPNFILWNKPEYTFYSGYCVKSDNLQWLIHLIQRTWNFILKR